MKFGYNLGSKTRPILISIPVLDLRGFTDMNNTKYY